MTLTQKRIAETIDNFYDDSSTFARAASKYKDVIDQLDESARTELVKNIFSLLVS